MKILNRNRISQQFSLRKTKLQKQSMKILKTRGKNPILNVFRNLFDKMAPQAIFFMGEFNTIPRFFYYLGGFIANGGYFAVLAYFIWSSFESNRNTAVISLQNDIGDCKEVPLKISGSFNLDRYGYWEGEEEYNPKYNSIVADFYGYSSTLEEYSKVMKQLSDRYYNISKISMYRDLAYNLNVLATTDFISSSHGKLRLRTTGSIGSMLESDFGMIGVVMNNSDLTDNCFGSNPPIVDVITNTLSSSFDYSTASDHCKNFANAFSIHQNADGIFNFKLDLASFSTALAVNNLVLLPSDLRQTTVHYGIYKNRHYTDSTVTDDKFDDDIIQVRHRKLIEDEEELIWSQINKEFNEFSKKQAFGIHFYISRKYINMKPIMCLNLNNDHRDHGICFIYHYNTLSEKLNIMYPVMKHYLGTDCYDDNIWGSAWYDHISELLQDSSKTIYRNDHQFSILLGLVVFSNLEDALDFLSQRYYEKFIENGDLIHANKIYKGMKAFVEFLVTDVDPGYPSQEELCGINSMTKNIIDCQLVTILAANYNFYIDSNQLQLFAGACRNSIYNQEMFDNAADTPPVSLIQPYYSCTPTVYDAVFNAIGVSFGNTDLYYKVGWMVFSLFLTLFLWKFIGFNPRMHIHPPEEEDEVEEEVEEVVGDNVDPIYRNHDEESTLAFY